MGNADMTVRWDERKRIGRCTENMRETITQKNITNMEETKNENRINQ